MPSRHEQGKFYFYLNLYIYPHEERLLSVEEICQVIEINKEAKQPLLHTETGLGKLLLPNSQTSDVPA